MKELKIIGNFLIQADKCLVHNTSDLIGVEKKIWIIDVAIPADPQIEDKEHDGKNWQKLHQ